MAEQPKTTHQSEGSSVALIIAVVFIVIAALGGVGYYYYNELAAENELAPRAATPTTVAVTPITPDATSPTVTEPNPTTPVVPVDPYEGWKTYTFRGDTVTPGFTIRYPAGYEVGQKFDKDGKTFIIYSSTDKNEASVMEILYETDGSVRFGHGDTQVWDSFDMVVKSFTQIR